EDVALVPSAPVPRSAPWRSFVDSGDRDGDAVARLLADAPADEDAARTRLEEMRQLADQRLSELLAVQLASPTVPDRIAEWETLMSAAVAPLVNEPSDILQVGVPLALEETSSEPHEPFAEGADALAVIA
ncbi:hypothetical protein PINS_up016069, partial [Pythium insidiosum]